MKEGDRIVVSQVGSSNRVFRSSVEYAYSQGQLVLASEYVPPVEENEEMGMLNGDGAEGTASDEAATKDTPDTQTQ